MRWILVSALALVLVTCAGSAAVGSTKVIGKIVDEVGDPVRAAQVRIHGKQSSAYTPVALDGTFDVLLNHEEIFVTTDVTATGFEKRSRNVVVTDGTANAGS